MRTLCGFCLALLFCTALIAQNRSGFVTPLPGRPTFGTTPALPGVQRTVGSVVHPGGSWPQIAIPGIPYQSIGRQNFSGQNFNRQNTNHGVRSVGSSVYAYPVPYPVYVGGGYGGYYDEGAAAPVQQQAQQPNIIVIYPSAQAGYPAYAPAPAGVPQSNITEVPQQQLQAPEQTEATHYLLAFKDHSIYSAVAYWVEGDTLHYFTSGNTHNQVSVSLVDRDLTKRLNEDSGLEVRLPPAK